jgi:HSP20 family protein
MAEKEKKQAQEKQEVQKVQPAAPMSPFEEMERLFEGYFPRGWFRPFHLDWPSLRDMPSPFEGKTPHVDVIDRDNEIVVKAALPGVDKKDLDISVTSDSVTIKGATSHEEKEEKGDYYRCEMSRGSYSRKLALPSEVDEDKAKATFKNGVLELTLPKTKKAKRRSVEIE